MVHKEAVMLRVWREELQKEGKPNCVTTQNVFNSGQLRQHAKMIMLRLSYAPRSLISDVVLGSFKGCLAGTMKGVRSGRQLAQYILPKKKQSMFTVVGAMLGGTVGHVTGCTLGGLIGLGWGLARVPFTLTTGLFGKQFHSAEYSIRNECFQYHFWK